MDRPSSTILIRTWSDKCRECEHFNNISKKGILICKPYYNEFFCNSHFLVKDVEDESILDEDMNTKLSTWFSKEEVEDAIPRIKK